MLLLDKYQMISNIQKAVILFVVLVVSIFALIFLVKFLIPKSPYTFDQSRVAVVKQIQSLSRYEAAQFTIEKVIDAKTNDTGLRQLLFGDKILLIAHGEVIAGFDFSTLTQDKVEVQGKNVTVHLPPPEILVVKLDSDKTKVYDRTEGLLSRGDKDLETVARAQAESEIKTAACESGILNTATENAKKQLTPILQSFGFEQVTLDIPQGSCK